MKKNKIHLRRQRRMLALLFVLILVFAGVQGEKTWVKIRHPFKYEQMVRQEAAVYQLDPLFVAAVINVESKFNEKAESSKGAKGLMQIMDGTAVWVAGQMKMEDFTTQELFDPAVNIKLGCWYLKRLENQYNGNKELMLAAYNGGMGNVSQWLKDPENSSDGTTLTKIPFPETEAYVKKVLKNYQAYQELYGH